MWKKVRLSGLASWQPQLLAGHCPYRRNLVILQNDQQQGSFLVADLATGKQVAVNRDELPPTPVARQGDHAVSRASRRPSVRCRHRKRCAADERVSSWCCS